jgi:hypothetical protein
MQAQNAAKAQNIRLLTEDMSPERGTGQVKSDRLLDGTESSVLHLTSRMTVPEEVSQEPLFLALRVGPYLT